jgi:tRNA A-37 threonylcarbamoyl transferase component Bud32
MPASLTCPNGHPIASTDTVCPLCGTVPHPEPVPLPTDPVLPAVPGYEVLDVLGRGGMGVVYKARQISLNRVVALKMIRDSSLAGPEERARFRAEALAVAQLQHPHVVQVYEVGEWRPGEGGPPVPFFSLEFVPGGSLAERLRGTAQPPRAAAGTIETLARAVHAAHERGIIHRDLKPANVLLTAEGSPKVSDFGLAKKLEGASGRTQTGAVVGTPHYMAPEQAEGKSQLLGRATDVWALGAILYEMLTGRPPFRGPTTLDTLAQVVSREPTPPSHLQPTVPRDLEAICLRCLEKQPSRRYATAAALAEDLQRFLTGRPTVARPIGPAERAARWVRRRPVVAGLALALLLLVLAGGGALIAWRLEEANRDRQAAQQQEQEQEKTRRAREAAEDTQASDLLLLVGYDKAGATPAELNAFHRLAEGPSDRVRLRFIETGLERPDTAVRLGRRGELAAQAAVGLDLRRKDQVARLLLHKLQDEQTDRDVREACLLVGVALGLGTRDEAFGRAGTKVAVEALARQTDPDTLAVLGRTAGPMGNRSQQEQWARAAATATDRLLDAMARETDPGVLAKLGRAVAVLAERLGTEQGAPPAATAADRLTTAALRTADPNALAELAGAAAALAPRLTTEAAQKPAGNLVAVMSNTTNAKALPELARAVGALADRLEPDVGGGLATGAASKLLEVLPQTTDPNAAVELVRAAVALAPRLTPQAAEGFASMIVAAIFKTTDPNVLAELVRGLDTVADRLGPGSPAAQTASGMLLAAAFQPTNPRTVAALARALSLLSARMSPEIAAPQALQLRLVVGQTTDPYALAGLVRGVGALDRKVRLEAGLADRLLDAMGQATDPHALAGLGQAVAALSGLGADEEARTAGKAAGKLLDAMLKTTDPNALDALGQALDALADRLGPDRGTPVAADAANRLLDAMVRTTDPNVLAGLGRTVDALAGRLRPDQGARVAAGAAGPLLDALARQSAPALPITPTPAGRSLEVLTDRLTAGDLVALLKYPTCVGEGRRHLLRALARRIGPPPSQGAGSAAAVAALQPCPLTSAVVAGGIASLYPGGRRPFADLWEAVDHLRTHHPDIDLSSPPSAPPGKHLRK